MENKESIINKDASIGKVNVNGKTISEKKCKHCGNTSQLAEWHLTMGFDLVWKCECPACKKVTIGL